LITEAGRQHSVGATAHTITMCVHGQAMLLAAICPYPIAEEHTESADGPIICSVSERVTALNEVAVV